MNEAQTAQIFKEALRVYAHNSISTESLGIFKGIEKDGVTVRMQLRGINLRITAATVVDVTIYERKIADLQETVKEQGKEIASLKKEAKKKTEGTYTIAGTRTAPEPDEPEPKTPEPRRRRKTT